jgi:DNA-binding MarR family transcriptional regulator
MGEISQSDIRNLARFRYAIRRLLHTSEEAARKAGLTPQHHQLLLGVAGFTGKHWATISDLAEFLQVRHHSVVGLVDRAAATGLVRREANPVDRREVRVSLTRDGLRKLRLLSSLHRRELNGMRRSLDLLDFERQRAARRSARSAAARGRRKG